MYDMFEYGNMEVVGGDTIYNTRDKETALDRMAMSMAFLMLTPGPKMLWQFQELGYEVSINFNGRTGPKPIRWSYRFDPDRYLLFKKTAALIDLKLSDEMFRGANYGHDMYGSGKRMWVSGNNMNVTVAGNFDVTGFSMSPDFQHTGTWYDYFTGEAIQVNNTADPIYFEPGEFHVWTDVQQAIPDLDVSNLYPDTSNTTSIEEQTINNAISVFPNPFNEATKISFGVNNTGKVKVEVFDLLGNRVSILLDENRAAGRHLITWNGADTQGQMVNNGYYIVRITKSDGIDQTKLLFLK